MPLPALSKPLLVRFLSCFSGNDYEHRVMCKLRQAQHCGKLSYVFCADCPWRVRLSEDCVLKLHATESKLPLNLGNGRKVNCPAVEKAFSCSHCKFARALSLRTEIMLRAGGVPSCHMQMSCVAEQLHALNNCTTRDVDLDEQCYVCSARRPPESDHRNPCSGRFPLIVKHSSSAASTTFWHAVVRRLATCS